ncbi:carbohydrate ABC transporter permease [Paenibacillus koleovorans]|uniref:carbohydrate ABC transporter permease n=1 Tax=Paenibacillus koleovorans TaxID=121608 RepID=UPI000FDA718C|nr:carbohydrate ABC transporter permease [Paenibacillus koleovorans]
MLRKLEGFDIVVYVLLGFVGIVTLLPLLHLLFISFADPAVLSRGMYLVPTSFSTVAYRFVFEHTDMLTGYRNSILYTLAYVTLALLLTVMTAYPLSKKVLPARKYLTFYFVLTMFVSGGLIPFFLVVKSLGLVNTVWAMVIPGSLSIFNMILMRTYFQSLPQEMEEAAIIDGAGLMRTLLSVILPVSKPMLMTIGLFYAVSKWNDYFNGLIFLNDQKLFPLQLMVRQTNAIIDAALFEMSRQNNTLYGYSLMDLSRPISYAALFASIFPILAVYPFIQKYFVKGVMIGSLKG